MLEGNIKVIHSMGRGTCHACVLLDVTKATFAYATYIGISIYEITTINNI
jgi:hypothetical protein